MLFEPAAVQVIPFLDSPDRIDAAVEIACGTGRLTRHMAYKLPPPVRMVATDLNNEMLEIARQKTNNDAVEFLPANAEDLPFADLSFDLAVCQFGLMFFSDKPKGIKEAYRVLKPGGSYFFSTWERVEGMPMLDLLFNQVLLPANKGTDPGRFLVPFSLYDANALQTLMRNAGFKNVQHSKLKFQSGETNAASVVMGFFTKHSIGAEIRQTDPEKFEQIKTEMENSVKQQFGQESFSFELAAHLVSGSKE